MSNYAGEFTIPGVERFETVESSPFSPEANSNRVPVVTVESTPSPPNSPRLPPQVSKFAAEEMSQVAPYTNGTEGGVPAHVQGIDENLNDSLEEIDETKTPCEINPECMDEKLNDSLEEIDQIETKPTLPECAGSVCAEESFDDLSEKEREPLAFTTTKEGNISKLSSIVQDLQLKAQLRHISIDGSVQISSQPDSTDAKVKPKFGRKKNLNPKNARRLPESSVATPNSGIPLVSSAGGHSGDGQGLVTNTNMNCNTGNVKAKEAVTEETCSSDATKAKDTETSGEAIEADETVGVEAAKQPPRAPIFKASRPNTSAKSVVASVSSSGAEEQPTATTVPSTTEETATKKVKTARKRKARSVSGEEQPTGGAKTAKKRKTKIELEEVKQKRMEETCSSEATNAKDTETSGEAIEADETAGVEAAKQPPRAPIFKASRPSTSAEGVKSVVASVSSSSAAEEAATKEVKTSKNGAEEQPTATTVPSTTEETATKKVKKRKAKSVSGEEQPTGGAKTAKKRRTKIEMEEVKRKRMEDAAIRAAENKSKKKEQQRRKLAKLMVTSVNRSKTLSTESSGLENLGSKVDKHIEQVCVQYNVKVSPGVYLTAINPNLAGPKPGLQNESTEAAKSTASVSDEPKPAPAFRLAVDHPLLAQPASASVLMVDLPPSADQPPSTDQPLSAASADQRPVSASLDVCQFSDPVPQPAGLTVDQLSAAQPAFSVKTSVPQPASASGQALAPQAAREDNQKKRFVPPAQTRSAFVVPPLKKVKPTTTNCAGSGSGHSGSGALPGPSCSVETSPSSQINESLSGASYSTEPGSGYQSGAGSLGSGAQAISAVDSTLMWIECTLCGKWRLQPDSIEPCEVYDYWTCAMNSDLNYNDCSVPQGEVPNPADDEEYVETYFVPGSIVWAKMDGYPWYVIPIKFYICC